MNLLLLLKMYRWISSITYSVTRINRNRYCREFVHAFVFCFSSVTMNRNLTLLQFSLPHSPAPPVQVNCHTLSNHVSTSCLPDIFTSPLSSWFTTSDYFILSQFFLRHIGIFLRLSWPHMFFFPPAHTQTSVLKSLWCQVESGSCNVESPGG